MEDLYYWRIVAKLSRQELGRLCGVSVRTVKGWEKKGAPAYAFTICSLLGGFPSGADWQGWRFHGGFLWSPEGTAVCPGDIRAIPFRRALLAEYERVRVRQAGKERAA